MTFAEALKKLNIEDYGERIFNSNSHGELFHLYDYMEIAKNLSNEEAKEFRSCFVAAVEYAEQNWRRPESVFQHMPQMLEEMTHDKT